MPEAEEANNCVGHCAAPPRGSCGALEVLLVNPHLAAVEAPAAAADDGGVGRAGGKELAAGKFEVVSADEAAKRQMAKATAEVRAKLDDLNKRFNEKEQEARKLNELWKDEANLALRLGDRSVWPDGPPPAGAVVGYRPASVAVLGLWKQKEPPRIKALAAVLPSGWPEEPEKLLSLLKGDRACVRDVAPDGSGKGLVALLVDAGKNRTQVVQMTGGGIARRFGRFSEKPGEGDDTLGGGARAVAVDKTGNVWVATDAWGARSVFKRGADGAPFEESVVGAKGALKKFSPDGRLLGAVSLLEAPMDLSLAEADGTLVVLISYRNVSEYHGAQVREGIMMVRVSDAARIGEIKAPAGSVSIDESGRVWVADVAGHIACYDLRGRKLLDAAGSAAPAVPDAKLPASSPLPAVVRADGKGTVWVLLTLARKLIALDAKGVPQGGARPVPESAGALYRLAPTPAGPIAVGDKACWRP